MGNADGNTPSNPEGGQAGKYIIRGNDGDEDKNVNVDQATIAKQQPQKDLKKSTVRIKDNGKDDRDDDGSSHSDARHPGNSDVVAQMGNGTITPALAITTASDGTRSGGNMAVKEPVASLPRSVIGSFVGKRAMTRPLSQHFLKSLSGMYCLDCTSNGSPRSRNNSKDDDSGYNDDDNSSTVTGYIQKYDLDALKRQNSAASPLVLAPMMGSNSISGGDGGGVDGGIAMAVTGIVERVVLDYMTACKFYGCQPNAGILTALRFSLPCLRTTSAGGFHDIDMLALTEVLLRHGTGALQYVQRLDFSVSSGRDGRSYAHGKAGFQSHGAFSLAKVLQSEAGSYIKEVNLQRNQIGSYGASALFIASSSNPTLEKLVMRGCRIGERGALVFAELISSSSECGLRGLDLSANRIGFKGISAIERALKERERARLPPIVADVEGNLIFQEVMNGVTHGLGILLVLIGSFLLSKRCEGLSTRHMVSCGVYSASLLALYTSSTLYHSLFILRRTKWLFKIMDKSAIYILIAGTYTPFLRIAMVNEPLYSVYMLGFLWCCCGMGMFVEFAYPHWKYRGFFSLSMYLSMGWSALICLPEVATRMPLRAVQLLVLGGVAYTAGVPFFVRNNNLDHAIWHLFVMTGSIVHWLGVYLHVRDF